jgi:DNA-binding LacI/PurR family transcriptional regulator
MNKRIPIVQFYRVAVGLNVPQILAEDEAGAEAVTDYLIKKGSQKIAMLLGPKELSLTQNRLKGYQNALRKNKIKFDKNLLAHVDFSDESVYTSLDNWLSRFPELDAIISISDKSAAQIITKLKNKKINVPKKIRVVGFGNEFVGEMLDPKLTTFDTQTRHIGEESSRLLIEQIISGKRDIITKVVPGKLIIRDSA